MAAAFDAQSSANSTSGTTTSWTHTPVGTPTGVVVFGQVEGGVISGITYGGVALTLVGNQGDVYCFKSTSTPPAGPQTVVVTGDGGDTTTPQFGGAVTVTGGDPTSPVRTSAGAAYSAVNGSVSITVPSGDVGVACAAGAKQGDTLLENDTATNTWSVIAGIGRNFSGSRVAGAVSSMAFTSTFSSAAVNLFAVSMAAAAAAGGGASDAMLLMLLP